MSFDWGKITPDVCKLVWGEPNPHQSTKDELRWGTHGSRTCDLKKGTWYDHEAKEGGGAIQLLERDKGLKGGEALDFLREHGFDIPDTRETNGHAAGEYLKPKRSGGKVVATYDYVDEVGDLLFQVQ